MTQAVAAFGRRHLPRGWRHLALQFAIWFGFLIAYQAARGFADRGPTSETRAFVDGLRVIQFEQSWNSLYELTFQRLANTHHLLHAGVYFTYWASEFGVVGLGLLWIYFRRHDAFTRVRNTLLLANVLGLVGYVWMPTAPPRYFTGFGFVDNQFAGTVAFFANPYAAMPSLHAADAVIIGVALAVACRRWVFRAVWLLWPAWVTFSVMATANHFWLDCVAGFAVAALAAAAIYSAPLLNRRRRIANAL
jgi:membrane-associated phospholipid phosphatase